MSPWCSTGNRDAAHILENTSSALSELRHGGIDIEDAVSDEEVVVNADEAACAGYGLQLQSEALHRHHHK